MQETEAVPKAELQRQRRERAAAYAEQAREAKQKRAGKSKQKAESAATKAAAGAEKPAAAQQPKRQASPAAPGAGASPEGAALAAVPGVAASDAEQIGIKETATATLLGKRGRDIFYGMNRGGYGRSAIGREQSAIKR